MQTFNELEIQKILSAKTNLGTQLVTKTREWPNQLETFILTNGILSGGAIASAFHDESPKDFDIYVKNSNLVSVFKGMIVSDNYKDLILDADEKYMEVDVKGKMVTVNATTFKNGIQVITREDASSRLEFDFVHCMPWLDLNANLFHISREQYDCISNKHLVKNPGYKLHLSDRRISKYTSRGWRFKPTE